jgi:hypothetical protein
MLLLAPPFGYPDGLHVSITAPNNKCVQVGAIASEFGCPPATVKKLIQCIRFSGRYDCLLSREVAESCSMLTMFIKKLGGAIRISPSPSLEFLEYLIRPRGLDVVMHTVELLLGNASTAAGKQQLLARLRRFGAVFQNSVLMEQTIERVLDEVKKQEKIESFLKNLLRNKDTITMKDFTPQGSNGNITNWLSENAETLSDKSQVAETIQQGNKYPAFLRGDKLIVATTESEGRQLTSELKQDATLYAIDRELVDSYGDGGSTFGGDNDTTQS